MRRNICAVFDIDDTLYLERDYVYSGFEAAGRWAAQWIRMEDFAEQCRRRFQAGRRTAVFNDVLCAAGLQPSAELVSALVEIYRAHLPSISLAADASEALREIYETAAIAVISDGPASSQSRKAEALGLSSWANPIVLTGLLGNEFCKPHPKAFKQVAQCRPDSAYVYIADNPLKDFVAPKQLGWATVRVRRPGGLHYDAANSGGTPDYEMSDCSGLPAVLAQM